MVGDYPRKSCVVTDFLAIDQPSTFNAVLGRPSLKALKAITSVYHLLMKFPTLNGVGKYGEIKKKQGDVTTRPLEVRPSRDKSMSSISGLQVRVPLMTPLT